MIELGKTDPGPPFGGDTSAFFLAAEVEAGWAAFGPYALHETNAYGAWMAEAGVGASGGYTVVPDVAALRAGGQYRVLTPDELVAEIDEKGPLGFTMFHPLCGGVPPAMAWESLHLFEHEVLPRLAPGD
jgi:hypothetical protein